jgi:hypothetical protein
MESDLCYLRSILGHMKQLRSLVDGEVDGLSLAGQVVVDNCDWLDCYIARLENVDE